MKLFEYLRRWDRFKYFASKVRCSWFHRKHWIYEPKDWTLFCPKCYHVWMQGPFDPDPYPIGRDPMRPFFSSSSTNARPTNAKPNGRPRPEEPQDS